LLRCRHVLVPTDFSQAGNRAARAAAGIAARFDAELHLLHVVTPPILDVELPEVMLPPLENLSAEMRAAGERRLGALADELRTQPARVHVHVRESLGRPASAICEAAEALGADLVVIGSHGHHGVVHRLLGATAERVVREAPCPVLVIKPAPAEA